MKRELAGTKGLLNSVTENRAKCWEQLRSWAEWCAYHRQCCLLTPKESPVGTLENSGSSAVMTYAERPCKLFRSLSFGGAPYSSRESSVRAEVKNDDPNEVPSSPPEKPFL